MTKIIVALIIFFIPVSLFAGTFTVTTTAKQDSALTILLNKVNVVLTNQGKPVITMDTFIQNKTNQIFRRSVREVNRNELTSLQRSWSTATQTQKDNIKTILGIP